MLSLLLLLLLLLFLLLLLLLLPFLLLFLLRHVNQEISPETEPGVRLCVCMRRIRTGYEVSHPPGRHSKIEVVVTFGYCMQRAS